MASSNTVHVTDIASTINDQEVQSFFAFCGKVTSVKFTVDGDHKSAIVAFAQSTAASTALMLNNTQLGPSTIHVTSQDPVDGAAAHRSTSPKERDTDELTQEEKPRSRIFAEYLAHGYVIGDVALQKAIDIDHKHGVTNRFMTTLTNLDQKYSATEKAKTADKSYQISNRATTMWSGMGSYFEKASTTPTGRRLVSFYTEGSRQVQDIHTEAMRLKDLKKKLHGGSAYKASGMERFFGKETPAEAAPTATADGSFPPPPTEAPPKA